MKACPYLEVNYQNNKLNISMQKRLHKYSKNRFGSDVVDKSRNVTQKCVIMKISLTHADGEEQGKRPSTSRLYKPSDSFEDLSIVTSNLQVSALSQTKSLGYLKNQKCREYIENMRIGCLYVECRNRLAPASLLTFKPL